VADSPFTIFKEDFMTHPLTSASGTIWFTGLSGAGKTTTAHRVIDLLRDLNRHSLLLDGDELRSGLNKDLSFDRASRRENARRTTEVALLAAKSGSLAVVSLISPYQDDRDHARNRHVESDLFFFEVFVDTPLEVCESRDPKGLYESARSATTNVMTGYSDPYERPVRPDLTLTPDVGAPDQMAQAVIDAINAFLQ
jgi:bifunctional enzyme CysN/CysC